MTPSDTNDDVIYPLSTILSYGLNGTHNLILKKKMCLSLIDLGIQEILPSYFESWDASAMALRRRSSSETKLLTVFGRHVDSLFTTVWNTWIKCENESKLSFVVLTGGLV